MRKGNLSPDDDTGLGRGDKEIIIAACHRYFFVCYWHSVDKSAKCAILNFVLSSSFQILNSNLYERETKANFKDRH